MLVRELTLGAFSVLASYYDTMEAQLTLAKDAKLSEIHQVDFIHF